MRQASVLRLHTALILFLALASLVSAEVASPARQVQVLKTGWLIKQLSGESHDIAALIQSRTNTDFLQKHIHQNHRTRQCFRTSCIQAIQRLTLTLRYGFSGV